MNFDTWTLPPGVLLASRTVTVQNFLKERAGNSEEATPVSEDFNCTEIGVQTVDGVSKTTTDVKLYGKAGEYLVAEDWLAIRGEPLFKYPVGTEKDGVSVVTCLTLEERQAYLDLIQSMRFVTRSDATR